MPDPPSERPRRTIVGGRPRKRRLGGTGIPRGIEVLLKKASVDPAFCRLLLEQRAAAAHAIALDLTPAETAILGSVPEAQLQAMIDHTLVPDTQRRAFLGSLGAAMLSALVAGCNPPTREAREAITGIRAEEETAAPTPNRIEVEKGIRPEDMTRWNKPAPTPIPRATPTLKPSPTLAETDSQPAPESASTPPVVRGIRPDRP